MILNGISEAVKIKDELGGALSLAFGCFDILHYGHVRFLKRAQESSAAPLAVGILDDELVRAMKGTSRPVNKAQYRLEVIDSLKYVDYAFIVGEKGDIEKYRAAYAPEERELKLWEKCIYCIDILRPAQFFYSTDFYLTPAIKKFFKDVSLNAVAVEYTEGISTTALIDLSRDGNI